MSDAWRFAQQVADLIDHRLGAFERRTVRSLHVDEEVALVFVRQEADGRARNNR